MRLAPTLPPPAIITYIGSPFGPRGPPLDGRPLGRSDGSDQRLDRRRRRIDDAQAPRGVELGARRVEQPRDDRRHLKLELRDLRNHDVRVVAVRADDDGVGLLDPGLLEELQVHAVPDQEAPGPALTESPESVLV